MWDFIVLQSLKNSLLLRNPTGLNKNAVSVSIGPHVVQNKLSQPVSNIWLFNIYFRQSHNCREGGQSSWGQNAINIVA